MQAKEIVKKTEELVRPAAERMGLTVWDVTYEKEGGEYMLTVTLDRESGVSIDDCEALSREIDPLLDRENYITDAYTFCAVSYTHLDVYKRQMYNRAGGGSGEYRGGRRQVQRPDPPAGRRPGKGIDLHALSTLHDKRGKAGA